MCLPPQPATQFIVAAAMTAMAADAKKAAAASAGASRGSSGASSPDSTSSTSPTMLHVASVVPRPNRVRSSRRASIVASPAFVRNGDEAAVPFAPVPMASLRSNSSPHAFRGLGRRVDDSVHLVRLPLPTMDAHHIYTDTPITSPHPADAARRAFTTQRSHSEPTIPKPVSLRAIAIASGR